MCGVGRGEASELAAEERRPAASGPRSAGCAYCCPTPGRRRRSEPSPGISEKTPPSGNKFSVNFTAISAGCWPSSAKCPATRRRDTRSFIRYEGLEHYLAARDEGKGVLILTGHLGAWEISSFYHSLMGYPMSIVIRRLDNPLVDDLVNHIRCLHGNQVLHKDDFARGLLASMRRGGTVGILMDTNMTPPQGSFVDFFGYSACTANGLARDCHEDRRGVLPGFLLWEEAAEQYVLRFGAPLCVAASWGCGGGCCREYRLVYQGDRGLCPPISRPVALGASPLEDSPAG